MISSKPFSFFSRNFLIQCSRVDSVWKYGLHDNKHIAEIGKKCYSSKNEFSKAVLTEEDRASLEKWLEMLKFQGLEIPQKLSEKQFQELYHANSKHQKIKYLKFLVKREDDKRDFKIEKEVKKAFKVELRREKENRPPEHIEYGLWKNSMLPKLNKRHFLDLSHHRLARAMQFGQPLVVDLAFEEHLKGKEKWIYARQLALSITHNRANSDPFNLTYCNVNFNSDEFKKFSTYFSTVLKPSFPMNISSKSYLDLFPKEKLIYLSPDAREEIKVFDHNAIYIIGGIVERGRNSLLTLGKAKMEGIKMQKLPLNRYPVFKGPNSKSIDISLVVSILLNVKKDGDWKKAIETVSKEIGKSEDSF